MQDYFRDPAARQAEVMRHSRQNVCALLSNLEVHADGAVHCCFRRPAIGNIRDAVLHDLRARRPEYWVDDTCWQPRGS